MVKDRKTIRGGYRWITVWEPRPTFRNREHLGDAISDIGFRVVLKLQGEDFGISGEESDIGEMK